MTDFFELAVQADASVDRLYGEDFAFSPFVAGADRTAPDSPDGSRAAVMLRAVFVDPEMKPLEPNSFDVRQVRRPGFESGAPAIELSAFEVGRQSCALGSPFVVNVADHLERLKTTTVYRVKAIFVSATGLVRLKVSIVG